MKFEIELPDDFLDAVKFTAENEKVQHSTRAFSQRYLEKKDKWPKVYYEIRIEKGIQEHGD